DESDFEIFGLSVDITRIKNAETTLRVNKDRSDFLAEAGLLLSESLDHEVTLSRLGSIAVPRLADWYAVHILDKEGREVRILTLEHSDPKKKAVVRDFAERFPIGLDVQSGIATCVREGRSLLYSTVTDDLLADRAGSSEHLKILRDM